MGTYTVTYTATSGCSSETASYTVEVRAFGCSDDILTISTTKFNSDPMDTYNIRDVATVITWSDSTDVSSSLGMATTCGTLTWDVTMGDDSALDTTIFTLSASTN